MTAVNPGPASQSTGNVAGGPYGAWVNSAGTALIGPGGAVVPLAAGGAGGVALYDGANSITSGTAQFSNAHGVSFGFNAQTITASVASQSVQTQASGAIAGTGFTSTTTAGTAVVGTNNTAGLSLGIPVYITTATQSAQSGISSVVAGGSTQTVGMLSFANSNGITFGLSTGALTGTITASAATAAPGISGIADSANTQTVGTLSFANSNGVTFGLSTGANTATLTASVNFAGLLSNINISAGTTSSNVSAVTFSNANGVSFGYDGTNVTATVKTVYAGTNTTFAGTNISGSITLNTAGINLALSGGAGGGANPTTVSWYENMPHLGLQFNGSVTSFTQVGSIGLQPFQIYVPLSFYRGMAIESVSTAVSTMAYNRVVSNSQGSTTATGSQGHSYTFGLYSRVSTGTNANSSNIISFASTSWTRSFGLTATYSNATNVSTASATVCTSWQYGWQLNNLDTAGNFTSSSTGGSSSSSASTTSAGQSNITSTCVYTGHLPYITGGRFLDIPLATSLSPGEYWAGIQFSSATQTAGFQSLGNSLLSSTYALAGQTLGASMFAIGVSEVSANGSYVQQGLGRSFNTSLTSTTFALSVGTESVGMNTYYAFMAQTK